MHRVTRRRLATALTLGLTFCAVPLPGAWGQTTWPSRPVKLVVPFPPGGGTDVLARILADRLRPQLGQAVIVENRPGATGNIGNDAVAKATDGHTVLVQATIIGMYPHVFTKLPYDPLKDLTPVGGLADSANVIVVNAASPYATLQDLVKAAKADPSRPLQYGTAGVGSPQHLAMEQMASIGGFKLQHITYRGTAPAVTDVLGNQLQFGAFSLSSVLPMIQGKKLRPLALMTAKRSALLPDVPSAPEAGFPGVDSSVRFALLMPASTPPDVMTRLAAATQHALSDASLKQEFLKAGYEVSTSTGQQVGAMLRQENVVWGPVVKQLGIKLD